MIFYTEEGKKIFILLLIQRIREIDCEIKKFIKTDLNFFVERTQAFYKKGNKSVTSLSRVSTKYYLKF